MTGSEALDPSLFIGSSSEGLKAAQSLQASLDRECEPTVWTQGAFGPGSTTISSLLDAAGSSDFAVLIATADDVVTTRGESIHVARDNVIFELGLFLGALGPDRVFLVVPRGDNLALPSDLAGVTALDYRADRQDGNLQAALGPTSTVIAQRVTALGLRPERRTSPEPSSVAPLRSLSQQEEVIELERELDAIETAARAQGWLVKTRSPSAFRLVSRAGRRYSFPIGSPAQTRDRLRPFAKQLKNDGLRVSGLLLAPVTP